MSNVIILLLFYLPSLIGLIFLDVYLYGLYRLAKQHKSKAQLFLTSFLILGLGVTLSWIIVLLLAINLVGSGTPVLSWEILLLPVFWASVLFPINLSLRK